MSTTTDAHDPSAPSGHLPSFAREEGGDRRRTTMTDAYIYDAVRTPRGKGRKDGSLHEVTPVRLAVTALQALQRPQQARHQAGRRRGAGLRHADRRAGRQHRPHRGGDGGLAETVAGVQVNRFCASGLEATNMAAAQVMAGQSPGRDRRRRREHEPRADGLRRRRLADRSRRGDPDVLRAAGHLGRHHRHQVRPQPRRRRRLCRRDRRSAPRPRGTTGYFKKSIVPVKDQNGVELLDHDELMRPQHHHADAGRARALASRCRAR